MGNSLATSTSVNTLLKQFQLKLDHGSFPCENSLQCTGKLFADFRGIRDTKIEKSRGIQDKISL